MAVQNSVLTNPSSFTALRTLNGINRSLDVTQNRVSTGLKVGGALDDASNFAIAQGIRAELTSLDAVTQGLNNAKGIGNVAIAGTTGISNLLQDVRQKLTELSNEGITTQQRTILTNDFNELLSQAANFLTNASFNGMNLIDSGGTSINTLSNLAGGTLFLDGRQPSGPGSRRLPRRVLRPLRRRSRPSPSSSPTLSRRSARRWARSVRRFGRSTCRRRSWSRSGMRPTRAWATSSTPIWRASRPSWTLQVQQQLSVQTLGVANQRPQSLLGLFR